MNLLLLVKRKADGGSMGTDATMLSLETGALDGVPTYPQKIVPTGVAAALDQPNQFPCISSRTGERLELVTFGNRRGPLQSTLLCLSHYLTSGCFFVQSAGCAPLIEPFSNHIVPYYRTIVNPIPCFFQTNMVH